MAGHPQVAVLGARAHLSARPLPSRPWLRLASLAALGLYGTLRWSTLLEPQVLPRLLGLLALALALAGGRRPLARRSRPLAALATAAALIAAFPIAGVPLAWVIHLRIAVTASAIGQGLTALPQALVPYTGLDPWVTLVIVLGAGVLLFDAALLVAFAPAGPQDLRWAAAALPLLALAAVPSTLIHPAFPYLDGLLLFALLAVFIWGERVAAGATGGALGVCALAALAAMFAGPALDRHHPWINPRTLAGGLTPSAVDTFDWSQGYGPIDWPHDDRVVLEIQARYPAYWKAENLDVFNGTGWTQGAVGWTPSPKASALRRWTETLTVTVGTMRIAQVIGAGSSQPPTDLAQHVLPGASPGTWVTSGSLAPGDAYRVQVYAPQPTPGQLQRAGADYAGVSAGYRTIDLAPAADGPSPDENWNVGEQAGPGVAANQAELTFPAFHSGRPIQVLAGPSGESGTAVVEHSVYGAAYRLARRLAAGAATPYEFVRAVRRYLDRGYIYTQHPPAAGSQPPLVSFLFSSHRGYCQQFAGAMALLLRMGGVPARVAVGFTPGQLDSATGRWLVTDLDAHAWVEVWFPGYGWVTVEATPPLDPALGQHPPIATTALAGTSGGIVPATASKQAGPHPAAQDSRAGAARARGRRRPGATGVSPLVPLLGCLLALLAAAAALGRGPRTVDGLVAELERALRRLGRPLPPGGTLVWLERRVSGSPEAAAYVARLRLARFAGQPRLPDARQRRALRRQLRLGLGPLGVVRALWALPPRWRPPAARRR